MNRILWAMDGDTRRLKLAALCQFSLAGEPIIYYGTEVGLSQQRDVRYDGHGHPEESRLPMVWGGEQDQELFSFYRQLIAFRKSHAALRSGRRGLKFANASILAYTRGEAGEELLFVFNLAQEPGEVELRGNWEKVIFSTGSDVQLTQLNGQIVLKLAESSGVVLS
jgi:glycosidase